MTTSLDSIARLLASAADGDLAAENALVPVVCEALRELAASRLRAAPDDRTPRPTELVQEAYRRLVDRSGIGWRGRSQFFVVAARAMRIILVDHARERGTGARSGQGWRRLIEVDDALTRLAQLDERKARLVELRFFAGLRSDDAAGVLEMSRSTAAEQWRMARAWIYRQLKEPR